MHTLKLRPEVEPRPDDVKAVRKKLECSLLEAKYIVLRQNLLTATKNAKTFEDLRAVIEDLLAVTALGPYQR